MGQSCR